MFDFDDISEVISLIPQDIKNKKFSILLPYYNESDIIVKNVTEILDKMTRWGFNVEAVVSDDGSKDDGYKLLEEAFSSNPKVVLIRSERNYGKGRALLTAYERSTGDYVLFLDSDLELPIEHLPYFTASMIAQNADVVIGSKQDPQSNVDYPAIRRIFSYGYYLIVRVLFNLKTKDTQTGIKLFKREVLEETLPYLLVKRFAFDIELLALINLKSYKIASHPVVLVFARGADLGRMSLDTVLHMFKDTFATFWRIHSGFWNAEYFPKQSLKYTVIDTADIYNTDRNSLNDIVVIKDKDEELPVFAFDALDRVYGNPAIDAVLPLLYPMTKSVNEEMYYTMMGNIFFARGYYPLYRPDKQGLVDSPVPKTLSYRKQAFLDMLDGKTPSNLTHTPFYYLHKHFPTTEGEFMEFIKDKNHLTGKKKLARDISIAFAVLFLTGCFLRLWVLALPLLILEFGIHIWYIYSLGIRKGVKYLILFDKIRIKMIINSLKKQIKS